MGNIKQINIKNRYDFNGMINIKDFTFTKIDKKSYKNTGI